MKNNNLLLEKIRPYFYLKQKILRIILKEQFINILNNEINLKIFKKNKLEVKKLVDFIIKKLKENNELTNVYYFSLVLPKETLKYFFKNHIYTIKLENLFNLNELYIEFPEKIQKKLTIDFDKNNCINEFYLQTNKFQNLKIFLDNVKINKFKLIEDKNINESSFNNYLNLANIKNEVILEGIKKYKILLNENIKKISLYETQNLNIKNNKIKYLEELNYIKHLIIKSDISLLKNLIKKIDKINKFYLNSYLSIEYNKPVINELINLLIEKKIDTLNVHNLKFSKNLKNIQNIKTLKFHGMDIVDTNLYIKNIDNLLLDNNKLNNNYCFLENINRCEIYISTLENLKYYKFKNLKLLSIGLYIDDLIKLKELFENIYAYRNNYDNVEKFEIKDFNINSFYETEKIITIINDFLAHKNKNKFKKEVLNLYMNIMGETTENVIPYFIHKEYFNIVNKKLLIYKI